MQFRSAGAWLIAALISVPFLVGSANAGEYVVLDSDAAGIEPGLVSAGDATITVPEGATVVLIDPAGETRVVSGPYVGPVEQARTAADDSGVWDRLTARRSQDSTTLGASRAPKFEGGGLTE
ncbi:MAG: hypothetical protein ACPGVA_16340 [Pikeienuella sp.]